MLKLKGKIVTDTATGLQGYLTHCYVETNKGFFYRFQPHGINPETGEPRLGLILTPERVKGGEEVAVPEDMPFQILNTEVEETTTGFKGVVTSICLHESGCYHATVQPKGIHKKTGQLVGQRDCNVRNLKGKALKAMPAKAKAKAQKEKPSPSFPPTMSRFVM